MTKNRIKLKILLATAAFASIPLLLEAQAMSSTNYKIQFDAFSDGGSYSSSSNYKLTDTVSEQATPTGEGLSSANYKACAGFECLQQRSLTVTFAVSSSPCTSTTSSSPPFSVPLGTLSTGSVTTAGNHICVVVTSDASGTVMTVKDANGGLASTGTPADKITSSNATLTAGTAGYGVCSSAASGLTAQAPYNGSCDATNHAVGSLTASPQTVYFASGAVTNAVGDLLTKASISGSTAAHSDYADTMTLVVTGTY